MQLDHLKNYDANAYEAATPIYLIGEREDGESDVPESLCLLMKANGFRSDLGVVLASPEGVVLGVGDESDPFIIAAAAEKLPEGDYKIAGPLDDGAASLAALGWLLGAYKFTKYKSQPEAVARLIAPENVDVDEVRRTAASVGLVRDLVNTPASDMLPDELEYSARRLAENFDAEVNVIAGDDLLDKNFPMIHAVGRASATAPRLIDLTWGRKAAPKVTLVGKGVCFDSGGLNMKGAGGMALMKKDMGGSAHVLGLARLIMSGKLDVRLHVLIPAVENAVSGDAFRPGDVLTSRKGLTVEIGNTDAEGRLVLADALDLGAEQNPDILISMATLTGAARIAVGPELAPFYTDDEALASAIIDAAKKTADPVWRMPLWKNYDSMLSSPIADLNNISGGSFAGSITAALFLNRFVPKETTWAHFDIYAWRPKGAPGRPSGGEAQAIRALYRAIERYVS